MDLFIIIGALVLCTLIITLVIIKTRPNANDEHLRKLEELSARLDTSFKHNRTEIATEMERMNRITVNAMVQMSGNTDKNFEGMRQTLERRLSSMITENERALMQMRSAIDETLSKSVASGLESSFKSVNLQLKQVYEGMTGIMDLSSGVTDLQRILAGVKTRGMWGEAQLETILRDILTPSQYEKEAAISGNERVDFAVKLPTANDVVLLPVDSKFPMDRYKNLLDAEESADKVRIASATAELSAAVREQAASIAKKYIVPPKTTDFELMFLPSEGLYAHMFASGMTDTLFDLRIILCGPSTFSALLSGLQVGFRAVVIEQHSADILKLLVSIKKSFDTFSANLAATRKSITAAANNLERAETNSRGIAMKLANIEDEDI